MKILKRIITKPKEAPITKANPLEMARAAKQARRDSGEIDSRRNPREVWESDKKSMRKAINANCFDCIGCENYIKRIRFCNIFTCPFWEIRPYSKGITIKQCEDWVEEAKQTKEDSETDE